MIETYIYFNKANSSIFSLIMKLYSVDVTLLILKGY